MTGHLRPGKYTCDPGVSCVEESLSVRAGALLALTGFTWGLQPCLGPGSAFKLCPGRAVSWLCLFPVLPQLCLRALRSQAQLGQVSSPALGLSHHWEFSRCPGLPGRPAPVPGCSAWLGPGGLELPVPLSRVPCRLGAEQLWLPSGSVFWHRCAKSLLPIPDRERGKSASPIRGSKKEIKLEVLSNPNRSMILQLIAWFLKLRNQKILP